MFIQFSKHKKNSSKYQKFFSKVRKIGLGCSISAVDFQWWIFSGGFSAVDFQRWIFSGRFSEADFQRRIFSSGFSAVEFQLWIFSGGFSAVDIQLWIFRGGFSAVAFSLASFSAVYRNHFLSFMFSNVNFLQAFCSQIVC